MKHNARNLAKFVKLVRWVRSSVPPELGSVVDPETIAIGLLERLWHATGTSCPRGDIGSLEDDLIAEMLGWRLDSSELVSKLIEFRWLDRCEEHRITVHGWSEHAPNWVKGVATKRGGIIESATMSDGPKVNDRGQCNEKESNSSINEPRSRTQGHGLKSFNRDVSPRPIVEDIESRTIESSTSIPYPIKRESAAAPNLLSIAPDGFGDESAFWESLASRISKLGVSAAHSLIQELMKGNMSSSRADRIVGYFGTWRQIRDWGSGALITRLRDDHPDLEIEQGWVPPGPNATTEFKERKLNQPDSMRREHLIGKLIESGMSKMDAVEEADRRLAIVD